MRYLKVTLLIGFTSALLVAGCFIAGFFRPLDTALWSVLGSAAPASRSLVQIPVFILLAFALAWTTIDISRRSLKAVVAVAALLQILSAAWVLNLYGIFFSPFPGALAIFLSTLGGWLYARSAAGKRKRILRHMLGERLSTRSFYALVNSAQPITFEGDLHETSILVCELFNHDDLMESLPPADYVAISNAFLRTSAEFLVEKGAYLDECDGETLRVIFGAPLDDPRHALHACEAALELVQRLENLNLECEARWHKSLDFRVGLNSGEVITAAYGSHRLGSFSVSGEPVDFARRLCVVNTIYGSRLLIGAGTYELAAADIEVRPIELLTHPETHVREEIYELLALKDALSPEELRRRDLFWKGVIYFREEKWDKALAHFEDATGLNGDAPLQFYIRRVEQVRDGLPVLGFFESEDRR